MLETSIRNQLKKKDILLMTHLVLGYPSFEENYKAVTAMAKAGVELIELQIPFSEPMADGPVILSANHYSLEHGTRLKACFDFADKICHSYPEIAFLFMTYYNIVFSWGERRFIETSQKSGIKGFIIPDLPPEEGADWLNLCQQKQLDNIFIFTPTHTQERLSKLSSYLSGFVYCVGRRGVTGKRTQFDQTVADQIAVYRKATELPLALGFGVQEKSDIDFLIGKADIATIGSKLIEIQDKQGDKGIYQFLKSCRNS